MSEEMQHTLIILVSSVAVIFGILVVIDRGLERDHEFRVQCAEVGK